MQAVVKLSSDVTKCHAYYGICTLSPCDGTLTVRFAKQVTRRVWNKVRFRNFTRLRNSDCATLWSDCATRIAQLGLRNSQDCATQIAQLPGLRNSDCATAFDGLRNSQDCATLLAQMPCTASNFKCILSAHTGAEISRFTPPWNFKLTQSAHQGKKISTFPPPWNFKWTWSAQQG